MERLLTPYIQADLEKKIVLLTGPRQCGKTTLAKMLSPSFDYLNFDNPEHRLGLMERSWDRSKDLVIFDELHKLKDWKSWLKGVYDTEGLRPRIIVTGSAKLDTYRKVGDSLAGRFFQFRLHPLDLKEINRFDNPDDLPAALDRLLETGGFPEPYFEGSRQFYNRWKRSHLDIILKQDMIALENVREITMIETLIQLLRKMVGSPVSYASLARDLQCSDKTVKQWLTILESMYIIFRITPFHRNIARSILKAPKFYFYDTGQVIGNSGVKLENLTACALLKESHVMQDCFGEDIHLYYLKTKDGKEIDFLVVQDEIPTRLIEVKWADDAPSSHFSIFGRQFPEIQKTQIVRNIKRDKTFPDGTEIRAAHAWLTDFSLP
jgi:uncharacterized protein